VVKADSNSDEEALLFRFHSAECWLFGFEVTPEPGTILYSIVFIALFYLLSEKEKKKRNKPLKTNRVSVKFLLSLFLHSPF